MRTLILTCLIVCLAGCASDGDTKTSHFEHDHEVAAHWPNDLADAAAKIRQRLDAAASTSDPSKRLAEEIVDLVSWVPEIAADTDLSEHDWIPLDNAAESLSASLRAVDNELTAANRKQTAALCELIEQSLKKIPSQLPSLKGSAS
ncbi:MAG: hypothetical protein F9B45_11570 [Phycisphaera sp. RhM]|nr:hypothetical protein [Phycisphaera sp. RhM]